MWLVPVGTETEDQASGVNMLSDDLDEDQYCPSGHLPSSLPLAACPRVHMTCIYIEGFSHEPGPHS